MLDQKALWSDIDLEKELKEYAPQMSVPTIQAFVARCVTEGVLRGARLVTSGITREGVDHIQEKEKQGEGSSNS